MINSQREIRYYIGKNGKVPFDEWLSTLSKDIRSKIRGRIARLAFGHFGDSKSVGDGVFELRIHSGAGYRMYFANDGDTVVLLLCGGDKSSQARDIEKAKSYWKEYCDE